MEIRLTKAQYKSQERIEAWLAGRPFKENSRDKNPQIPELTLDWVLDNYCPKYPSAYGAFYTPVEMVYDFWMNIASCVSIANLDVLDPCAGIGNLLYGMENTFKSISAVEADGSAFEVGVRLFQWAEWTREDAFRFCERRREQFDLVVMNPPFNITWATGERAADIFYPIVRSEYLFLRAAENVLRADGEIAVIAPYNYVSRMPKAMKVWFDNTLELVADFGELKGEFQLTKVKVHGWLFAKKVKSNIVKDTIWGTSILVPVVAEDVFQDLIAVQELPDFEFPASPTQAVKSLTQAKRFPAANWVKSHQVDYGSLYWHGFRRAE